MEYTWEIKHFSDKTNKTLGVKVLKKKDFVIHNSDGLSGEAPKELISVYEHGKSSKSKKKTWIKYLSKLGNKRYPSESITEHLISEIGILLGFDMAETKLFVINGKIRFFSSIFLNQHERIIHAADILKAFLDIEDDTLENIDKEKKSQDYFKFHEVIEILNKTIPINSIEIQQKYIEMLVFDCILGINDRHFYNWGIINSFKKNDTYRFSPIYDSARGLFWNITENKVKNILNNEHSLSSYFDKYMINAIPKIGILEIDSKINHIQLLKYMLESDKYDKSKLTNLISKEILDKIESLIVNDFKKMISIKRKELILRYLNYRFKRIKEIIDGKPI